MIPSSLLRSLERFFGGSLSGVRLEIGSPLPAPVGAEAVAWNDRIWIADPVPDFSSPDIVRTLAHEFAHICQQRAEPNRPAFPVQVGDVEDPLEAEAEACAQAFLSGRRCPVLTADSSPVLRRVLSIVPDTAKFRFDSKNAKPAADFPVVGGKQLVICHLTNGYTDVDNISDAVFWNGETAVRSAVSDPAELKTLRFGFIQFARFDALNFSYVGKTTDAGEININVLGALEKTLALDSFAQFSPFMSAIELPVSRGIAPAYGGDHPALKVPAELVNRTTQTTNYLYQVIDRRRFWTVLTARVRATGSFRYLVHHSWDLLYQFQFTWASGTPKVLDNKSFLTPNNTVAGPPKEAELAVPASPFTPDVSVAAIQKAVTEGLPNREDAKTRTTQLPPNVF